MSIRTLSHASRPIPWSWSAWSGQCTVRPNLHGERCVLATEGSAR